MAKTIQEINEKIKKGEAVVLTAEEIIDFVAEEGVKKAAQKVDVVTTGTFGPMCSSGAYFNVGHTRPRIKLGGGRSILMTFLLMRGLLQLIFIWGLLLCLRKTHEIRFFREDLNMVGPTLSRIWLLVRMFDWLYKPMELIVTRGKSWRPGYLSKR